MSGHDGLDIALVDGGTRAGRKTVRIDLEIETAAKGRYNVYFQDHVHNTTWEADINANVAPVVEALAELARHRE